MSSGESPTGSAPTTPAARGPAAPASDGPTLLSYAVAAVEIRRYLASPKRAERSSPGSAPAVLSLQWRRDDGEHPALVGAQLGGL